MQGFFPFKYVQCSYAQETIKVMLFLWTVRKFQHIFIIHENLYCTPNGQFYRWNTHAKTSKPDFAYEMVIKCSIYIIILKDGSVALIVVQIGHEKYSFGYIGFFIFISFQISFDLI